MRLNEKTAIVTGAAHGIGRAIAERFAEEGARVFIADLDTNEGERVASALRQRGLTASFVACDVSSEAAVGDLARAAAADSRRIDVVCNNAAYITTPWHGAADAPDEEWEKSFRVSLMGTQLVTRHTLPLMIRQNQGSIINVSSVQGLVAGRNSVAYTSIKHALIGFTRSIACDYGAHNVRCNAICPGAITTRISPAPGSELHQRQISKTFLGRIGDAREVAHAALFLASDESSYVTGSVLAVDGGWTAI